MGAIIEDREAIRIREELVAQHPGTAAYEQSHASSRFHYASILLMSYRLPEALGALCAAGEAQHRLAAADPGNSVIRGELAQTRQLLPALLAQARAPLDPARMARVSALLGAGPAPPSFPFFGAP